MDGLNGFPDQVVALAEESIGAAVVLSEQIPQGEVLLEAARSAFMARLPGRVAIGCRRRRDRRSPRAAVAACPAPRHSIDVSLRVAIWTGSHTGENGGA